MTKEEILEAVDQLSTPDLEEFVSQAIAIRARRREPSLSHSESVLLLQINQGVSPELRGRSDELNAKSNNETLMPEEHFELLQLIDKIEAANVERTKLLATLADMRGVSLSKLMQDLGIISPALV